MDNRLSSVLLTVLLAAAVAGCTTAPDLLMTETQGQLEPPDQTVVTKAATDVFAAVKMTGSLQISGLRAPPVTSLADWMVCMRSDAPVEPRYAIFFTKKKVDGYRLALGIDGCTDDVFAPAVPTIDDFTQRPGGSGRRL
jgi:hypothetical protein